MADGRITYQIEVDNKGAITALHEVESAAEDVGTAGAGGAAGIDKMAQASQTAANIGSAGLAMLASSLDRAVQRVDTLQSFPKVMESLGVSTKVSTRSVNKLKEGIEGLPTTLDDAVAGTKRLFLANRDIGKSTKYFIAANNAIAAGGAPMQTQQNALEQLLQAYAKGKPDQMEWLSIQTAMPQVLDQVAQAMGITMDELQVGLTEGDISMESFMQTLNALNEKGVNGMASLEVQAKAATGGIATSFANFKTSIVNALGNVLMKLEESEAISNFFDALKAAVGTVSKAFIWLAEKLSPILPILAKLAPLIVTVVAALTAYEGIARLAAAAQALLNMVMNANPILRIVMLLSVLIGAIMTLWQNSEEFREAMTRIWAAIKESVAEFVQGVKDAWAKVKEFFASVVQALNTAAEWFINIWQTVKEKVDGFMMQVYEGIVNGISAFTALFKHIKESVVNFVNGVIAWWNEMVEGVTTCWTTLRDHIVEVWENIKAFFTETIPQTVTNIVTWFQELPTRIKTVLLTGLAVIGQWVHDLGTKAREAARNFIDTLWNNLLELPGKMWDMGVQIVEGIGRGIANAADVIWQKLKEAVEGAWHKVLNFLGIESPSKLFRDTVGAMIPAGIAEGIDQASVTVTAAMDGLNRLLSPANAISNNSTVNYYIGGIQSTSTRLNESIDSTLALARLELGMA